MTNEELKVLDEAVEYLSMLRGSKAIYFSEELSKIYDKQMYRRKEQRRTSNIYNKENKKYHQLTNQLYYHRKKGNQAKIRELEDKLKNYKK